MKRYEIIILLGVCLSITYLLSIKIAERYECTLFQENQFILEQLSGVNERLDEMYQCNKYNGQEMWTVSQCEDLREGFLNSR